MSSGRLLFVTDLDASLLDDAYSYEAATPALKALRERKIPLIFNSSKTVAEMQVLARELGFHSVLIAENGALLALHQTSGFVAPASSNLSLGDYHICPVGLSRQRILASAHALRARFNYQFSGFADWSEAELSSCTGLAPEMARNAMQRHATEPIIWEDSEARWAEFLDALSHDGIRALRGGRFMHLMGAVDKADGMRAAVRLYQEAWPEQKWTTVALGDSENDVAMLEAADIAVVIPHRDGARIRPNAPRVVFAGACASQGWNAAVLDILETST